MYSVTLGLTNVLWLLQETYKQIKESYDCIIRSRYDILAERDDLNLSQFDLNNIWTSNHHWRNSTIHDDNFYMSNQENSNKVFPKIFDDIVNYNREQGIMDGSNKTLQSI